VPWPDCLTVYLGLRMRAVERGGLRSKVDAKTMPSRAQAADAAARIKVSFKSQMVYGKV
jgi:hypothetical protein